MLVVGVTGSLRARSSNAALLRAAAAVAPAGVELEIWAGLASLPYFNPDADGEAAVAPPAVAALRALLAGAGAVLLCSPEYAHGVPGALKNALDWLVSDGKLVGKPVAVVTAGPGGGEHASAQLVDTLATMSWRVVEKACLRVALARAQLDDRGEVKDPDLRARLRDAVAALVGAGREGGE